MKLILGLIFILLDWKITVGTAVIGLLPDFIGCFLILKALEQRRDAWRHLAFALTLACAVLFTADLIDKAAMARVWCQAGWLLAETGMLVLLRRVIRDEKRLRELFPVVACIRVLRCILDWVPLLGTVFAVADIVVALCFLAAAWKPLTRHHE